MASCTTMFLPRLYTSYNKARPTSSWTLYQAQVSLSPGPRRIFSNTRREGCGLVVIRYFSFVFGRFWTRISVRRRSIANKVAGQTTETVAVPSKLATTTSSYRLFNFSSTKDCDFDSFRLYWLWGSSNLLSNGYRMLIALMMKATQTSETLVNWYQSTRRYNPEDSHLRTHRSENLKSYLLKPPKLLQVQICGKNGLPCGSVFCFPVCKTWP
jgi:hypothetical protein